MNPPPRSAKVLAEHLKALAEYGRKGDTGKLDARDCRINPNLSYDETMMIVEALEKIND